MGIFTILRDSQINSLSEAEIDCSGCTGKCCQMNWDVELSSEEAAKLSHIEKYGRFFLQRINNLCDYQSPEGKCLIWDRRPRVCRQFDCRIDDRPIPESKYGEK